VLAVAISPLKFDRAAVAAGIEERLPMFRPLLATGSSNYWQRFQVPPEGRAGRAFYTPACFKLRRITATSRFRCFGGRGTMIAGNMLYTS